MDGVNLLPKKIKTGAAAGPQAQLFFILFPKSITFVYNLHIFNFHFFLKV